MAKYRIEDVGDMDAETSARLRAAGVGSTTALLRSCCTPAQRAALAQKTGISEALLLKLANMADLYRIEGIRSENSELLEAAGVESVPQLANCSACNLALALTTASVTKGLGLRAPAALTVWKWIHHARSLPRLIEH